MGLLRDLCKMGLLQDLCRMGDGGEEGDDDRRRRRRTGGRNRSGLQRGLQRAPPGERERPSWGRDCRGVVGTAEGAIMAPQGSGNGLPGSAVAAIGLGSKIRWRWGGGEGDEGTGALIDDGPPTSPFPLSARVVADGPPRRRGPWRSGRSEGKAISVGTVAAGEEQRERERCRPESGGSVGQRVDHGAGRQYPWRIGPARMVRRCLAGGTARKMAGSRGTVGHGRRRGDGERWRPWVLGVNRAAGVEEDSGGGFSERWRWRRSSGVDGGWQQRRRQVGEEATVMA